MKIIFSFYFLLLVSSFSLKAKHKKLIVNYNHSEFHFEVSYLKVSSVTGRFNEFIGEVEIDENGSILPQTASLKIKASSIDTGNKIRDGHLKKNDFLQTYKHPSIFYQNGKLKIRDIEKKIPLTYSLTGPITDSWKKESYFLTFKGSLKRSDFDLNWNKALEQGGFLVGDEIQFWGTLQLQEAHSFTQGSKHMIPDTKYLQNKEVFKNILPTKVKTKQVEKIKKKEEEEIKETIIKNITISKDYRKDPLFLLAYLTMGFIAFLATVVLCLQGKYFFLRFFPEKYKEQGYLGIISDLLLYAMAICYVWAMWQIGYA